MFGRKLFHYGGGMKARFNKFLRETYPTRLFDIEYDSRNKVVKITAADGNDSTPNDWQGWMLGLARDCFNGVIETQWGSYGQREDVAPVYRTRRRLG